LNACKPTQAKVTQVNQIYPDFDVGSWPPFLSIFSLSKRLTGRLLVEKPLCRTDLAVDLSASIVDAGMSGSRSASETELTLILTKIIEKRNCSP